jgi:glyoxalase family protein
MIHRIVWRVASQEALDFWAGRLGDEGIETERDGDSLRFADPEGLGLELRVVDTPDAPLIADHPEVPREMALQGFDGARAYARDPEASKGLLDALGFHETESGYAVEGERHGWWVYDEPPAEPGQEGAGTVHHIAWASQMGDLESWRERARAGGARPTEEIDRFWFHSIYFREPSGVLFEIATLGPGFAADEDPEHLGESLVLPPRFEPMREQIEAVLTPVKNPRVA